MAKSKQSERSGRANILNSRKRAICKCVWVSGLGSRSELEQTEQNRLERGEPMGGKPRMANERLRTRTRSLGVCSVLRDFPRRLIAPEGYICVRPVQSLPHLPSVLPVFLYSCFFFAGCLLGVRTLACLLYEFTTSA